jgi:hypothetical protein
MIRQAALPLDESPSTQNYSLARPAPNRSSLP